MKKKFQLEVPGGADKVLLHTCCAPCSSAIIECLMQHGVTPVIYYCNPNIYPLEEYIIRKDECTRYAQSLGLEIIDADTTGLYGFAVAIILMFVQPFKG